MHIGYGIQWKYPNARPMIDFVVTQNPDGTLSLTSWNVKDSNGVPIPQPVQSDLDSWALSAAKQMKIAELNAACENAIYAGFSSSATGTSHQYAFTLLDQQNMNETATAMLQDSTFTSVSWKTEDAGEVSHTAAQFQQLCKDARVFKLTNITKYRQLKANVLAATTVDAVKAITWS